MPGKVVMSEGAAQLIERRRRVGLISAVCFVTACVGLWAGHRDSAWPAAFLRIGIVLGAIWLCLPTSRRPTVWNQLTMRRLALIAAVAVFFNRVKVLIPMLAIIGIAAWIVRPKKRR